MSNPIGTFSSAVQVTNTLATMSATIKGDEEPLPPRSDKKKTRRKEWKKPSPSTESNSSVPVGGSLTPTSTPTADSERKTVAVVPSSPAASVTSSAKDAPRSASKKQRQRQKAVPRQSSPDDRDTHTHSDAHTLTVSEEKRKSERENKQPAQEKNDKTPRSKQRQQKNNKNDKKGSESTATLNRAVESVPASPPQKERARDTEALGESFSSPFPALAELTDTPQSAQHAEEMHNEFSEREEVFDASFTHDQVYDLEQSFEEDSPMLWNNEMSATNNGQEQYNGEDVDASFYHDQVFEEEEMFSEDSPMFALAATNTEIAEETRIVDLNEDALTESRSANDCTNNFNREEALLRWQNELSRCCPHYPPRNIEEIKHSSSPLHLSLTLRPSPPLELVQFLLGHPRPGTVPTALPSPLLLALTERVSLSVFLALFDHFPEDLASDSPDGLSLLHCAALHRSPAAITLALLERSPQLAQQRDKRDTLPLHYALLMQCDEEVLLALLRAYPLAAQCRERASDALPLHWACLLQAPLSVVRELLRIHPSALQETGFSPFLRALSAEDAFDVAELLPMHCALLPQLGSIWREQVQKRVRALDRECEALVRGSSQTNDDQNNNVRNDDKDEEFSTLSVSLSLCEELLRRYPDGGRDCLSLAIDNEAPVEVVEALIRAHPKSVNERDKSGRTPLQRTVERDSSLPMISLVLRYTTSESVLNKPLQEEEGEQPSVLCFALHRCAEMEKESQEACRANDLSVDALRERQQAREKAKAVVSLLLTHRQNLWSSSSSSRSPCTQKASAHSPTERGRVESSSTCSPSRVFDHSLSLSAGALWTVHPSQWSVLFRLCPTLCCERNVHGQPALLHWLSQDDAVSLSALQELLNDSPVQMQSALQLTDREGRTALHCVLMNEKERDRMRAQLLAGMPRSKVDRIELFLCAYEEEETREKEELVEEVESERQTEREVVRKTVDTLVHSLLHCCPTLAVQRDRAGRLPLHVLSPHRVSLTTVRLLAREVKRKTNDSFRDSFEVVPHQYADAFLDPGRGTLIIDAHNAFFIFSFHTDPEGEGEKVVQFLRDLYAHSITTSIASESGIETRETESEYDESGSDDEETVHAEKKEEKRRIEEKARCGLDMALKENPQSLARVRAAVHYCLSLSFSLSSLNALHTACLQAHCSVEVIRYLLSIDNAAFTARNSVLRRPLHCAALAVCKARRFAHKQHLSQSPRQSIFSLCLSLSPESVRERDLHGHTPLHILCMHKELCDAEVREVIFLWPNSVRDRDVEGRTPLHLFLSHYRGGNRKTAVSKIQPKTQKLAPSLESKVEEEQEIMRRKSQHDALLLTMTQSFEENIDARLLSLVDLVGKDVCGERDAQLQLPLHVAAANPAIPVAVIERLLQFRPEALTTVDRRGFSSVQIAEANRNEKTVQYLRQRLNQYTNTNDVLVTSNVKTSAPKLESPSSAFDALKTFLLSGQGPIAARSIRDNNKPL